MNSADMHIEHLVMPSAAAWTAQPDVVARWQEIRRENPLLRSPYFSPRFAELVSNAGATVELGVVRDAGRIMAILPFERKGTIGLPVGRGLNDAHGPIAPAGFEIPWLRVLKACRLRRFDFHAAPLGLIDEFAQGSTPAFLADLGAHPEGYIQHLSATKYTLQRQPQKARKLARLHGSLKLELDSRDPQLLQRVLAWKSNQYRRSHILDIFALSEVVTLMNKLHQADGEPRGQLSILFAGTTPVAGHFGLRERDLLHYWYPAYDPQFAAMSPGTQLFIVICEQANSAGIRQIDFGYGHEPYKEVLCNVQTCVQEGTIASSIWNRLRYQFTRKLRRALNGLWFKRHLKALVRAIAPRFDQRRFTR